MTTKPNGGWKKRALVGAGAGVLVVLPATAVLAYFGVVIVVQVPKYIDKAKVAACKQNLRDLYRNFVMEKERDGAWPSESGVLFFLQIWKRERESRHEPFARRFTCPGVPQRLLAGLGERAPRDWYRDDDWARIDSTWTAYAARDVARFPIDAANASQEALVADDNELAESGDARANPNHVYVTLVLMADGEVRELEHAKLREQGVLGAGKYPVAGPDCPVPELRKLSRQAIR